MTHRRHHTFVIPAKAGIQTLRVSAIRSPSRATLPRCVWIPAFAGMTVTVTTVTVTVTTVTGMVTTVTVNNKGAQQ